MNLAQDRDEHKTNRNVAWATGIILVAAGAGVVTYFLLPSTQESDGNNGDIPGNSESEISPGVVVAVVIAAVVVVGVFARVVFKRTNADITLLKSVLQGSNDEAAGERTIRKVVDKQIPKKTQKSISGILSKRSSLKRKNSARTSLGLKVKFSDKDSEGNLVDSNNLQNDRTSTTSTILGELMQSSISNMREGVLWEAYKKLRKGYPGLSSLEKRDEMLASKDPEVMSILNTYFRVRQELLLEMLKTGTSQKEQKSLMRLVLATNTEMRNAAEATKGSLRQRMLAIEESGAYHGILNPSTTAFHSDVYKKEAVDKAKEEGIDVGDDDDDDKNSLTTSSSSTVKTGEPETQELFQEEYDELASIIPRNTAGIPINKNISRKEGRELQMRWLNKLLELKRKNTPERKNLKRFVSKEGIAVSSLKDEYRYQYMIKRLFQIDHARDLGLTAREKLLQREKFLEDYELYKKSVDKILSEQERKHLEKAKEKIENPSPHEVWGDFKSLLSQLDDLEESTSKEEAGYETLHQQDNWLRKLWELLNKYRDTWQKNENDYKIITEYFLTKRYWLKPEKNFQVKQEELSFLAETTGNKIAKEFSEAATESEVINLIEKYNQENKNTAPEFKAVLEKLLETKQIPSPLKKKLHKNGYFYSKKAAELGSQLAIKALKRAGEVKSWDKVYEKLRRGSSSIEGKHKELVNEIKRAEADFREGKFEPKMV